MNDKVSPSKADSDGSPSNAGQSSSTLSSEVISNARLFEQLRDLVESELKCAICQQLVNNAININCSHTFCCSCLAQWRRETSRCPICREVCHNRTRVLMIDNLIRRYCQLTNIKLEKISPVSSPVSSTSSTITSDSWLNFIPWPEHTPSVQRPINRDVGVNTSPQSRHSDSETNRQRQIDVINPFRDRENRPDRNFSIAPRRVLDSNSNRGRTRRSAQTGARRRRRRRFDAQSTNLANNQQSSTNDSSSVIHPTTSRRRQNRRRRRNNGNRDR